MKIIFVLMSVSQRKKGKVFKVVFQKPGCLNNPGSLCQI